MRWCALADGVSAGICAIPDGPLGILKYVEDLVVVDSETRAESRVIRGTPQEREIYVR